MVDSYYAMGESYEEDENGGRMRMTWLFSWVPKIRFAARSADRRGTEREKKADK